MRLAQRVKRRRLALNQLVVNPFVSRAQEAACYAKDDPNWDCKEWSSKTKGRLPKRKRPTTNANPLRTDPTRTGALRKAFYRAIQSRLNELKRRVNTLVLTDKSFALNVFCATGAFEDAFTAAGHPVTNQAIENADYKFMTLPAQVEAFRRWLGQQIISLFGSTTEQIQESFWYQYIQEGFEKGAGRAFDSMAKTLGIDKTTARWNFLRQAFGHPVAVDKVKLIAGRVFTELKGVTDAMAQSMTRVLADGLTQGQSPRTVAREMAKTVDDIGSKRALVIARTETSRAHAEGQLIAMEKLGAQRLGVQVEWSPSGLGVTKKGYPSPCPLCEEYVGKVYTLEKAQGLIPHHPNCLCSWIPHTQFSKKAPTNNGLAFNAFCPTGPGGGIDDSCSPVPKWITAETDDPAITKELTDADKAYPRAGDEVSGLKVRDDVPNTDSIGATWASHEYTELPGIRSVPIDSFDQGRYWAADDDKKVDHLVSAIKESKEINPLIAVTDHETRAGGKMYILEGGHRIAALKKMGVTHIPALVIVDHTEPVTTNVFCPTGEGGGIDPSCSPGGHGPEGFPHADKLPSLKVIKTLPGSTGAQLVEDEHGNKFVKKKGKHPDHLRNEFLAEQAYRAAGVLVPDSHLYETPEGPVKLSKWIEGTMLNELPTAKQNQVRAQLQKDFAADAVLADWDVIGLQKDNILVTGTGQVYRIDVGGSLKYRAQGAEKGALWNDKADEINSMRTLQKNASSVWAFGDMSKQQVKDSVVKLFQKQDKFLEAFPSDMKSLMKTRMNNAAIHAENIGNAPVVPKPTVKPKTETPKPPKEKKEIKIIAEAPTSAPAHVHVTPISKTLPKGPINTADSLIAHIKEHNTGKVKFSDLYIEKIKVLNPNGVEGGVFVMPRYEVSKKNAHRGAAYLEKVKSLFPEGTVIKQGYVTKEGIAHPEGPKIKMFKKIAATVGSGEGAHWYAEKGSGHWGTVQTGASHKISSQPEPAHYSAESAALKLPSAEYSAISKWKGSAYGIRKAISEGDLSGESGHAGNFLKAIAKCPIYKGTLFRGIHGDYAKAVRDTLIKNGVGGTWQDDAPMGCSRNTHTPVTGAGNADLLFKVSGVHNGRMIEDISSHHDEHEVVMPPGAKYRVTGITVDPVINGKKHGANGHIHTFVELEQLPGEHFEHLKIKSPTGNKASKVVKNAERLKAGQADAEEAMSTVVLVNPDGNVTHIGKYVRRDSDSIPTLAIV